MSITNLLKEESDLKTKINNLRFSIDFGKTKSIHLLKNEKKSLARVKTVMNEKILKLKNEII